LFRLASNHGHPAPPLLASPRLTLCPESHERTKKPFRHARRSYGSSIAERLAIKEKRLAIPACQLAVARDHHLELPDLNGQGEVSHEQGANYKSFRGGKRPEYARLTGSELSTSKSKSDPVGVLTFSFIFLSSQRQRWIVCTYRAGPACSAYPHLLASAVRFPMPNRTRGDQ
jgi:hypothetical protein